MTICIISMVPLGHVGGVATFNEHFIRLFNNQNHRVVLLTVPFHQPQDTDDLIHTEESYTVVTVNRAFHRYYQYYLGYFASEGSNLHKRVACGLAMQDWLLQNHKKYGIDIIEVPDGGGLGIFFCHNDLPPVVLTAHGSNLQISQWEHIAYDEQGKLVKHLELLSYQHAAVIISNSILNSENLKEITSRPIVLATVPWFSKSVHPPETIEDWGLVLGWLRYNKGPQVVCAALRRVIMSHPQAKIKWAGGNTTTLAGYSSTAEFLRHQFPEIYGRHLEILGSIEPAAAAALLSQAGFVIIPSVWETFNYVALEAASAGKAIIISKGAGSSYLFSDEQNALLVNANDPEQLADAILRLQSDGNLRKNLGAQARELMQQRFHAPRIVEERMQIYERVISNHKPVYAPTQHYLSFLDPYLTIRRKLYFNTRRSLKKVIHYFNKNHSR